MSAPTTNGVSAANGGAAAPAVGPTSPLQSGIVRSVLSGDTVIVRPKGVATPGSERTIHVAGLAAPRMGSRDRDDEPQAFPSREHLRLLLVGREVRYRVEYTVPVAGGPGREFAHVYLPPKGPGLPDTDVAREIISAGWAKVHDSGSRRNANSQPEEEEEGGWKAKLRELQEEAKAAARGVWGPDELFKVDHTMPDDTQSFLAEYKGKPLESVVEQVRDGSMLRVRLFLSPRHHQLVNLSLAGVKSPRVAGAGGPGSNDRSEEFGEEAKFFVESRLLQRNIKVTLLSMPQPTAAPTPFSATASAAPPPPPTTAAVLIGTAVHPVGDIAQFLLAAGLARCVDWHAGMLASIGGMERYRAAEKAAKDKRLNLWNSYAPTNSNSITSGPVAARTFEAVVCRIISGDTIHIRRTDDAASAGKPNAERRIQLSSIRQPQTKDPKQAGYAAEAREFLRKRLIGKAVTVQMDYIKPKEGDFDEREYATIKTNRESNIGEALIQRGLATVQRHRRDDEDRSPAFDALMAAEAQAIAETKGLHSGKEHPPPRMGDASENAAKANSFLPGLKRAGRVPAVVDFVASGSRFKLIVPRENVRVTFVLAGIRAPRTARNPSEKDEPFGREGLDFTTRRALQRDVEVEFVSTDKVGGFIGSLFLNKTENLAVSLVEHGFAGVHGYSAESTIYGPQLVAAEERAKAAKIGMWHSYDADAEKALNSNGVHSGKSAEPAPARREYVDVVVSDVRGDGAEQPFSFAVQILDDRVQQLEQLMAEFGLHHRTAPPAGPGFTPRGGDLVSAQFSQDGLWYRAQVKRSHPGQKRADVVFIDYGNGETLDWKKLRPLDTKFGRQRLAPMALEARLSFVKLFDGKEKDYVLDALDRFRQVAEGRKLIANVDYREPGAGGALHLTLYDPANPASGDPTASINVDLAREGLALLDQRKAPYWNAYQAMTKRLQEAVGQARRSHAGAFEYGDPTQDDDL